MTELEAAAKIISSFMGFIQDSGSYAVIVTHLAREILKHIQVRVDGIEASGLDDEYNLIVDRTPGWITWPAVRRNSFSGGL